MSGKGSRATPLTFANDAFSVASGDARLGWMWAKYENLWWSVAMILGGVIGFFWLLRRLLGIGRTKVIVETRPGKADA